MIHVCQVNQGDTPFNQQEANLICAPSLVFYIDYFLSFDIRFLITLLVSQNISEPASFTYSD